MARPRSRGSRRATRARGRASRGAGGGGGLARYVIPVAVAGALLWYLMPKAEAGQPGGAGDPGKAGTNGGVGPAVPVPIPQPGTAVLASVPVTVAGNLYAGPGENTAVVRPLAVNDIVIAVNYSEPRNGWIAVFIPRTNVSGWAPLAKLGTATEVADDTTVLPGAQTARFANVRAPNTAGHRVGGWNRYR